MSIVPRFIIVDDVDPSIQYTGSWFSTQGTLGLGNASDGPPYENTLHGANSSASLSFAFNGTQIKVLGSFDPTQNAAWQCFIDNVNVQTIPANQLPTTAVNNLVLCEQNTLVDGPHILTVNATASSNQTFWFDDIQYVPSASVPLDQAAIIVSSLDPQLQYGAGWEGLASYGNMTSVTGSVFTYNFIGISVSWYGWISAGGGPNQFGGRISPTYSIDGQTPESFAVGTSRAQSTATNQTNSKIFETPLLPAGPHTLKVVYEGNSNSNPLTLEFLVVQNGTISSTTTSGSGIPGKSIYGKSSIPVGAIVGGTIGGLALIVFALLGFLFLRQRRKRSVQEWSTNESPTKEWSTQEWSTQAQNSISIPTLLDYTPLHPLHPSNTPSSPQTEQTESVVTHIAKGHVVMLGSETECSTGVSQTAEPLSRSSSGVTACPTNIRSVPRRQPTFTLANPSESPSVPVSPGKTNGEAEASTSRRPRSRGNPSSDPNDTWVPDIVLHADSGVRMPSATVTTSAVDVPPAYTPD